MFRERQIFKHKDATVEVLGDPHLGKRFVAGVPLNRRDEREEMVWDDFSENVVGTKADIHVCMEDLFDNFTVDDTTIVKTALAYKIAAAARPDTEFFILMGNHDMSRDAEKMSSFRVFKEILMDYENIHVVDQPMVWNHKVDCVFGFFPYAPFRTSHEVMTELLSKYTSDRPARFEAIFGHWDLDSFGEMPHNIFPHDLACTITDTAYTGHIHLPDIRDYGNLELVVVGSMQPYSHSEDPEHRLYVSLTLDMFKAADPSTLKDKCVRLILGPEDIAPEGVDALQYTTKNLDAPEMDEDLEVVLEDFDFKHIIMNEMSLQGVDNPEVLSFINGEFDRLRAEEMV